MPVISGQPHKAEAFLEHETEGGEEKQYQGYKKTWMNLFYFVSCLFVCYGIGFLYDALASLELKLIKICLLCLPIAGIKGACHHATRKKI